jgi:hypothetical protein
VSELSFMTLAFGLGLLGFVEPCSVGVAVILYARFRLGLFGRLRFDRLLPKHGDRSLGLGLLFGLRVARGRQKGPRSVSG